MTIYSIDKRESKIYKFMSLATRQPVERQARDIRGRLNWSADTLEQFRLDRCRNILQHAGANVPYYRQLFREAKFKPETFATFAQLEQVPVLTRQHVKDQFTSLQDPSADKQSLRSVSTGGTTGSPVRLLADRASDLERKLVTDRMYALAGRRLGTSTLLIAGSPIDAQAWNSLVKRIKNYFYNVTVRSSFNLTPESTSRLIEELASNKYEVVIAYASVFDILSANLHQRGLNLQIPKIIPSAEPVSNIQRERWHKLLGAEVFEIYGSREMNSIAGESSDHNGLVINSDIYHVEITDSQGRILPPGNPGLITITSLLDRGMPLIRYQLGDIGILSEPAGDIAPNFPRLRITHGRMLDVICCPSGKMLPGEFFPHLLKEISDHVERFQVIQERIDRIVVRVQPRSTWIPEYVQYLQDKISKQIDEEMQIDIEVVEKIEVSASGKFRMTINRIPPEERPWALSE